MPLISQYNSYNWTSMPIISQTIPYHWTSMPLARCNICERTHFGNLFLEKWTCIFWKKSTLVCIWVLFQKWVPGPNRSVHMILIEILCKTAVSMSRDVPSESKSIGTNSKYSSLARMFTWSFMICPFHIFHTLFSHFCGICYFFMLNTGWIFWEKT